MGYFRSGLTITSALGALVTLFSVLGPRTQASELILSLWGLMTVPSLVLAAAAFTARAYQASVLAVLSSAIMLTGTLPSLSPRSVVLDPDHHVVWANVLGKAEAIEATLSYADSVGADLVLIAEWPARGYTLPTDEWHLLSPACSGQPVTAIARDRSVSCHKPEPDQRGSVTVDIGEDDLTLIAMHAAAPFVQNGVRDRRQHLQQAVSLAGSGGPAVIVGDFNAVPWSPALNVLTDRGFQRATIGARATWLGRHHVTGLAIDHAFGRDVDLDLQVGPSIGSDHYPILIRMKSR